MKFFDMHADIGTDIFYSQHNIKETHLPKFEKGNIKGVFTACFFDGHQDWQEMQAMIKNCREDILRNKDELVFALDKNTLIESDKPIFMISCEGLCGLKQDPEGSVNFLYENGVRVASLVWNEVNALASGWRNDPQYGVTDLGKQVIKELNKHSIIVDVSHINEKGFWDVLETSERPIIATHSNARRLCNHERNLTDQQIKAIGAKGGVIGLNACGDFVDEDKTKQDCLHLALHAKYMADLIGVNHIGCGFDFMDFLAGFQDDEMLIDMNSCLETNNLVKAFKEVGFTDLEIEDICFNNVYNFVRNNI